MYIDEGFRGAISHRVLNIICWWHQRENVQKKTGIKQKVGRILLSIMYASNKKIKNDLIKKAERLAEEDVDIAASKSFKTILDNCSKTALISLKVFTAGTITNSYSESINSLLRRAGMNTRC